MIKVCQYCGKEFKTYKNCVKYCSKECSSLAQRKRLTAKCEICGKEFETRQKLLDKGLGKYCSRKCYEIAESKNNEFIIRNDFGVIKISSIKYGDFETLIDIDDIERCKPITWHIDYAKSNDSFYVRGQAKTQNGKIKRYKLSRFIMNTPKSLIVDHINGNTLDNRKENLRNCSYFINSCNNKRNTSGRAGVYWDKQAGKWNPKIRYNGKNLHLGYYSSKEEAIEVRRQAELKYFGEIYD